MTFFTAINCMDGRVQLPVIQLLKNQFKVEYIDMVTEPGPVRILAEQTENVTLQSIFHRVDISIEKHKSQGIAVVTHYDCAGNPVDEAKQLEQLDSALDYLSTLYPGKTLAGLWVDASWNAKIVREGNT